MTKKAKAGIMTKKQAQANIDKKDQGRVLLDKGSTPLVPDEDAPTIMKAIASMTREGGETYKTPIK
jgi:hypothetical protein